MIFANTAPAYYAKGIPVIPLRSREKRPIPLGWSSYHNKPVPEEQAQEWITQYPDANIGMVLGKQSSIVMMDIDSQDPEIVNLITSLLPPSPWTRVGKKGCVLAFKYSGTPTFRIHDSDGGSICELLSERTQCVLPPSIHPDTRRPYVANCDLLSVVDELPVLDDQVERILRGALSQTAGVHLSITGASFAFDFVSSGARDVTMTSRAGAYSQAVMRGERSLVEVIGMLKVFDNDFVERVAGDEIDINKHIKNLITFLHRDVLDKGRALPRGWDEGLTEKMREQLGLNFEREHVEWSFGEMRDYLKDEFERHPEESDGRTKAIEYILSRVAASNSLSKLEEDRILQYIVDVGGLGVRLPTLRSQVKDLRMGEINGNDHTEIAGAVIKDFEAISPVRTTDGNLWQWKGSHWEVIPLGEIVRRVAKGYGSLPAARKASDHSGIARTVVNIADQEIKRVKISGVNFANGFLTESLKLLPHDPDYGMTYTLPFRYLPDETLEPAKFFQFLDTCWGDDPDYQAKLDGLQEALCVTLFGKGSQFQRVVLLQGIARSGKTQLLKIAQALVPDGARSFIAPTAWADKFLPTMLLGKLINVCGELSESKKIDGMRFKDIVDGGEMPGQFKNQGIFSFRPTCTHWFASNHTPKTNDTSEGFNRRWLIFQFNKAVPPGKLELDIGEVIAAEEREMICAWAVKAWPRLQRQPEFTLSDSHRQIIREMSHENNSVKFFMEESRKVGVVRDSGKKTTPRITEDRLYKEYWSFCLGPGGAKPVGSRAFRQNMRELQGSMGFKLIVDPTDLGGQEVSYECLTLVARDAA